MGIPRLKLALGFACSCVLWACQANVSDGDVSGGHQVAPAAFLLEPAPTGGCEAPYAASDVVQTYVSKSGFFRVHYTRSGQHAVPSRDGDADGIPDYAQTVGQDFDEVEAFYQQAGFRAPLHESTNDAGFDVYLVDFATSADGQYCRTSCAVDGCSGHMLLENDFDGRNYPSQAVAIRLVASHEFFHAIQAAYTTETSTVLAEGTAVWASEAFDASTGDLERQVPGYLATPERSLAVDPTGNFSSFNYGSALFFQFLDEHVGREVLSELWDELALMPSNDPALWPDALDVVLTRHDTSLAIAFATFAEWSLFTGPRADAMRAYAAGDEYPEVAEKVITLPFSDDTVRVFPLSARYYTIRGNAALKLAAAATLDGDDGSTGLQLLIASERQGRIADIVRVTEGPERRADLQLAAADTFHVVLLNTRHVGESTKPSLCVGTSEQVDACSSGESTPEPGAGAGLNDAGTTDNAPPDAPMPADAATPADSATGDDASGADAGEPAMASSDKSSSGCSVTQGRSGHTPYLYLYSGLTIALSLYLVRRRQRQLRR